MRDLLVASSFVAVCLGFTAAVSIAAVSIAAAQPRPDDVQAAAAAFAEGQRAQLRGDYARAAELFELADRAAPNAGAVRSAIRNHRAAGQLARAATLVEPAAARYPSDAEITVMAQEILTEARTSLAALVVECEPACSLAIDGRAAGESAAPSFRMFLDPGTRQLVASWPGRATIERTLEGRAGSAERIELVAPAGEPDASPDVVARDVSGGAPMDEVIVQPAPPPDSGGISPVFFGVGAGLTAIVIGLGVASGIDTLSARDAYVLDPTREGYEDGVGRQWRTTGLFIGAAALGVTTLLLGIFADWDGTPSSGERATIIPWIHIDGQGAALGLAGRFGGDS